MENVVKKIPVINKTISNIPLQLLSISRAYNIPIDQIDFDIIDYKTLVRDTSAADSDFKPLDENEKLDDATLLSPTFEISQDYDIAIHCDRCDAMFPEFKARLASNKFATQIFLIVEAGSVLHKMDDFSEQFLLHLNKKLLRNRLLIGMFDEPLKQFVKNMLAKVRIYDSYTFEKEERILIMQSIVNIPTIHDRLIPVYKKRKKEESLNDKVDHSDRGFLLHIYQGDIILEYIKQKKGHPGRDCRGNFIDAEPPITDHRPTFKIADSIEMEETSDKIFYKAKQNGFVSFKNGLLSIEKESTVKRLNFKETGSIKTEIDSDIVLNVTEKEYHEDAIGAGSYIKVYELNSVGAIGPNTKIEAKNIDLRGMIHRTASIRCETGKVKTLKGTLRCKEIIVDVLDGGTIYGDVVYINKALGGQVFAKEVYIKELAGLSDITASRSIVIDSMTGEDNRLIIDPICTELPNAMELKRSKIAKMKQKIKKISEDIDDLVDYLTKNKSYINDLKNRILDFKSKKKVIPKTWLDFMKGATEKKQKIFYLQSEISSSKAILSSMEDEYNNLQNSVFSASVVNNGKWIGYNAVIFKLLNSEQDVRFVPKDSSSFSKLTLKEVEPGHFEIGEHASNDIFL